MIFSVQNLMYSVDFSPDLVQIQVRETVSGVFLTRMDIPIQVWPMVEVIQRDFNEHHMMQVPITENHFGTMQMVEEVRGGGFVAQLGDDVLVPWEEAGSAENPNTKDEDEGFSETMTPPAPQQSPAMEPCPALRTIENLQDSSAARQLSD